MVKKFVALLDLEVEDVDDSSQDEIVVVPFVKPPPVLIDLDSDDEPGANQKGANDKDKGKAEDKKSNAGDTAAAGVGVGGASSNISPNCDTVNAIGRGKGEEEGDKDNVGSGGDNKDSVDVVVVVPNNAGPSSSTTDTTNGFLTCDSPVRLPEIRIAQSIFETVDDDELPLLNNSKSRSSAKSQSNVAGSFTGGGRSSSKDPKRATPKKAASSRSTTTSNNNKRKRQSSAGSGGRTAEEIQKLLSTLGVIPPIDPMKEKEGGNVSNFAGGGIPSMTSSSSSDGMQKNNSNKRLKRMPDNQANNTTSIPCVGPTTTSSSSPPAKPKRVRKPRNNNKATEAVPQLPLTLESIEHGSPEGAESHYGVTLETLMVPPEVPSLKFATTPKTPGAGTRKRVRSKKSQPTTTSITSTTTPMATTTLASTMEAGLVPPTPAAETTPASIDSPSVPAAPSTSTASKTTTININDIGGNPNFDQYVIPGNAFVSVQEELSSSATTTTTSTSSGTGEAKKNGKKRSRQSLEKTTDSNNDIIEEDTSFTLKELDAVNANKFITNVVGNVISSEGSFLAPTSPSNKSPSKKRQRTRESPREEQRSEKSRKESGDDDVESFRVVVVDEGQRVVKNVPVSYDLAADIYVSNFDTVPSTGAAATASSNPTPTSTSSMPSPSPSTSTAENNYLPSTWSPAMVAFYDTPKDENLTMDHVYNRMSGDRRLWSVREGFFRPKGKVKRIRCENCHQWGHTKRLCPEPIKVIVCIYCGQKGHNEAANPPANHNSRVRNGSVCRKTMCLNCGKSHDRFSSNCRNCSANTKSSRSPPVCGLCSVQGHRQSVCPDNWRRFHSVTSVSYVKGSDGLEMEQFNDGAPLPEANYRDKRHLFCANCGRRGHTFHLCNSRIHFRLPQYIRPKFIICEELKNRGQDKDTSTSSTTLKFGPTTSTNTSSFSSSELRENGIAEISESVTSMLHDQDSTQRKVTVQEDISTKKKNPDKDCDSAETIRIQISNNNNEVQRVRPARANSYNSDLPTWECAYPECSNRPTLGNSCETMFLIPSDHKALLHAQSGKVVVAGLLNGLENIKSSNEVQICILRSKHVAHIVGRYSLQAKEELVELVKALKKNPPPPPTGNREGVSKKLDKSSKVPSPETVEINSSDSQEGSSSSSSTDYDEANKTPPPPFPAAAAEATAPSVTSEGTSSSAEGPAVVLVVPSTSKPTSVVRCSPSPLTEDEILVLAVSHKPPPEIITLEDSEEEQESQEGPPDDPSKVLSVTLLTSEWNLIFPDEKPKQTSSISKNRKGDIKNDLGILKLLSSTFNVDIFVSKESYTVTIQGGDEEGRVLAKDNLVFWLECQAGRVDFSLQYEKRPTHDQLLSEANANFKRGKHYERNRRRRERRNMKYARMMMKELLHGNEYKLPEPEQQEQHDVPVGQLSTSVGLLPQPPPAATLLLPPTIAYVQQIPPPDPETVDFGIEDGEIEEDDKLNTSTSSSSLGNVEMEPHPTTATTQDQEERNIEEERTPKTSSNSNSPSSPTKKLTKAALRSTRYLQAQRDFYRRPALNSHRRHRWDSEHQNKKKSQQQQQQQKERPAHTPQRPMRYFNNPNSHLGGGL